MARTLLDKVWEAHGPDAAVRPDPALIGCTSSTRTTPQAFQMLKDAKLKVRMPERTFGTLDHILTTDQARPYADPWRRRWRSMIRNAKDFGLPLFDMATRGIVHVIGPSWGSRSRA